MAWCRSSDKPLSEPMVFNLLTHMCVTRLQWVHKIGETPVRAILWWPTTKMLILACLPIQTLEQEGGCQKSCKSLCSEVYVNHFYQMKVSPESLNFLIYSSKYWVDRPRRTIRRKVLTEICYQQIYRLCHHVLHQDAHKDCNAPSGKQHEPLSGVWGVEHDLYSQTAAISLEIQELFY